MTRRVVFVVIAVLAAGFVIGGPRGVLAHATLLQSEPPANAFLQRGPTEVTLSFAEPVDPAASAVRVLDGAGGLVHEGAAELSATGTTLRLRLPSALGPGFYNVIWSNVSRVDGHALRGAYPFTVLNADGSLPAGANLLGESGSEADPPPSEDGVAVRLLALLGLLGAAGPALIILLAQPPAAVRRRLAFVAASGVAVVAIATVLSGFELANTYESFSFRELVFETRSGRWWLLRWAALGVVAAGAWASLRTPGKAWPALGALAGVAFYLVGFTATSHAAAGTGSNWAMAFDALHGWAAVAWVAAVAGLAFYLRLAWREHHYAAFAARFGLVASLAVFVAAAAGLLNALVQVDSVDRLTSTNYGVVLALKVAVLVPLGALAAWNARWGRRRAVGRKASPRPFLLTVTAEALLGLVIVALGGVLTQTTAAKSVPESLDAKPFASTLPAGELAVRLAVDPNRTGFNTFTVQVRDAAGAQVEVQRVRLVFRYREDQQVGPSTLVLARNSSGDYLGQGPYLTLEGGWQVEVEVRRADKDDVRAFYEVRPAGAPVAAFAARDAWGNPAAAVSWNTTGGLVAALIGLGVALFKGRIPHRRRGWAWSANGATLAGFGLGTLLLFGVHGHEQEGLPQNPIAADADSINRGREIYLQNCMACHGRSGVPPPGLKLEPYPLDLTVHAPLHADGQLFRFIADGLPGTAMRAWGEGPDSLSDEEIWHLVNFLRTLGSVTTTDR
ncbi:MAG: copper resistance protein CopC [Dehalococcoidia bacterium]